jgi:hypothetical protein
MNGIASRLQPSMKPYRSCSSAAANEPQDLPTHAQVVIIGGGIIGNSVAYHLAEMGVKDVLLLERNRLTSGTTWHAAGLMVTFGSKSETSTEMRIYTRDLYSRLEAETGQSTGFMPVGFIELATDKASEIEFGMPVANGDSNVLCCAGSAGGIPPHRRLQPQVRRGRARDRTARRRVPLPALPRRRRPGRILRQGGAPPHTNHAALSQASLQTRSSDCPRDYPRKPGPPCSRRPAPPQRILAHHCPHARPRPQPAHPSPSPPPPRFIH